MSESAKRTSAYRELRRRNIAIFVLLSCIWLIFDQLSKSYFADLATGVVYGGPYGGIFELLLVHNTGGAWGALGNMTGVLGVVSLFVCVFILVYLIGIAPASSVLATVGLSLVFAGGIGNAIDRFTNGYVIDFISLTFIDFPVFNIADIGVTCGIVIFLISFIVDGLKARKQLSNNDTDAE